MRHEVAQHPNGFCVRRPTSPDGHEVGVVLAGELPYDAREPDQAPLGVAVWHARRYAMEACDLLNQAPVAKDAALTVGPVDREGSQWFDVTLLIDGRTARRDHVDDPKQAEFLIVAWLDIGLCLGWHEEAGEHRCQLPFGHEGPCRDGLAVVA